jgi:integrase/recombinase XerD
MYGAKTKRKVARNTTTINASSLVGSLSLVEMFERFMAQKRTEGLARKTLEDYEVHFGYLLGLLGGDMPKENINADLFRAYNYWMINEKGLSPVTANVRIRTMRAFVRFAFVEVYVDKTIHEKIKTLNTEKDSKESFTTAEVKALLDKVDTSTFAGFRDFVMVCVLLDTIVRISELMAIKLKREQLEAHETKTCRARTVPISTKTCKLLADYMSESEDFNEGMLFLSYDGRSMLPNTWRRRLSEYGELASFNNKRVSPHTFRHTGALFYILNGGDPFSLQKILGHSDMSMVRKYIQMTNADVKRQHNAFSPLRNIKI